jgi:TRAP-type C4-dicarboxylate transport system substrate-binding protein
MQENQMHRLLISTVVSLAWVVPAMAQDASRQAPAAANTTRSQGDVVNQGVQSFQQRVQQRLMQAGFSNIEMVPTSILIRAIDRDGNPVMLSLSPASLAALLEAPAGQNDGSGNDTPSRQPPTTDPSAGDAK